ncbi:MAG: hypothetical protein WC554_04280 [Clostridia bacterium]
MSRSDLQTVIPQEFLDKLRPAKTLSEALSESPENPTTPEAREKQEARDE